MSQLSCVRQEPEPLETLEHNVLSRRQPKFGVTFGTRYPDA